MSEPVRAGQSQLRRPKIREPQEKNEQIGGHIFQIVEYDHLKMVTTTLVERRRKDVAQKVHTHMHSCIAFHLSYRLYVSPKH